MATIAALTEDFTGAAPGTALAGANTIFDTFSGAGSAVFITDPFDATRQMAQFTTTAQSRSAEAAFPPETQGWIWLDTDIDPPDVSTAILSLYDDTASTNKILDLRVLAGTRTLQLRNVSTVLGGFGPTLADNTKYRIFIHWNLATGSTPAKVVRAVVYGGTNLDTLVEDSGNLTSTTLASVAGSVRVGWISSSTAVNRIGRIRGDNSATMPTNLAPFGTPAGLTVTPLSATSVRVAWQHVAGATGYDVERVGGAGGTVVTSDVAASPLDVTGLAASTEYTFRVRAVQ
jgi:hypothetical protein